MGSVRLLTPNEILGDSELKLKGSSSPSERFYLNSRHNTVTRFGFVSTQVLSTGAHVINFRSAGAAGP
jgi:hypothetical protein